MLGTQKNRLNLLFQTYFMTFGRFLAGLAATGHFLHQTTKKRGFFRHNATSERPLNAPAVPSSFFLTPSTCKEVSKATWRPVHTLTWPHGAQKGKKNAKKAFSAFKAGAEAART